MKTKSISFFTAAVFIQSTLFGQAVEAPAAAEQPALQNIESAYSPDPLFTAPKSDDFLPTAPPVNPNRKSAFVAVGLSYLLPGLGHVYLNDYKTASGIFSSAASGISLSYLPEMGYSDRQNLVATAGNIWIYGIYAAYRDVRNFNGNVGYYYKMPQEQFADLAFAPFQFSVLKKPEVWGGLLGTMAAAAGVSYLAYSSLPESRVLMSHSINLSPLVALPVGIGEEAFFRGFLQSLLAESVGPTAAIALSAATFGVAHIGNAFYLPAEHQWRYFAFSLPLITSFGAYAGWVTQKNHSLKESVALHTWYDFILLALDAWATRAAIGRTDVALALPF